MPPPPPGLPAPFMPGDLHVRIVGNAPPARRRRIAHDADVQVARHERRRQPRRRRRHGLGG